MDTYIFGTVDYTVFLGVTILSIAIGLYFGWIKKPKKAVQPSPTVTDTPMPNFGSKKMNEYLMGSGNLKVFPVAMSLIASFISGVAILGTPSEIYYYGTQYSLIVVAIVIQGLAVSYIYLPVFSALQVRSSYENKDQLVPLFVVQSVGHIYGIPGLFIAGIFGAGLSSLSVFLNSTSLVILQDIVRGCFKMQPGETASAIIVKATILIMGLLVFGAVLLLEKVSGILSICMSLVAIATSSTFGIFTLGVLVPWANTVGTAVGGIAGFLLTGWITFGSQIAAASGQLNHHRLPVSLASCPGNVTAPENVWVDEEQLFPLFRLSFQWINPIGALTVVVVGSLVSLVTNPTDIKSLDSDLISPVIHRFLPKECFKHGNAEENSVQDIPLLIEKKD
ncbi:GD22868 [Drosophila simulans]|uniref:GD22868 n=1 Tax=Drosophila simulans TaxID=7240 RepID=B4Q7N5_DROSI|nr:GD22868 [Drosophila simulans]